MSKEIDELLNIIQSKTGENVAEIAANGQAYYAGLATDSNQH